MRSIALSLSALGLLTAGAAAQGSVWPPSLSTCFTENLALAPVAPNPYASAQQCHLMKTTTKGSFYIMLTVTSLQTGAGGVGGQDMIGGTYNAVTKTVTWDNSNAHPTNPMNTVNGEFGAMFYNDGSNTRTYMYVDQWIGSAVTPRIGWWDPAANAWKDVPVTGTPATFGGDGALAKINGQAWIFYINGVDIDGNAITLTPGGATITGPAVKFITGNPGTANSPTPIIDSNGELIAFSHHDVVGSDNDHMFSFDLSPSTQSLRPFETDTTTWYNNGGFAAGTFMDAHSSTPAGNAAPCGTPGGATYRVYDWPHYWISGGRAKIGTNMEITANVPPTGNAQQIILSYSILSSGFVNPIPVPGFGAVGISNILAIFPMGVHDQASGEAVLNLPLPNDPSLQGARIPGQGFAFNPLNAAVLGSNTFSYVIE